MRRVAPIHMRIAAVIPALRVIVAILLVSVIRRRIVAIVLPRIVVVPVVVIVPALRIVTAILIISIIRRLAIVVSILVVITILVVPVIRLPIIVRLPIIGSRLLVVVPAVVSAALVLVSSISMLPVAAHAAHRPLHHSVVRMSAIVPRII